MAWNGTALERLSADFESLNLCFYVLTRHQVQSTGKAAACDRGVPGCGKPEPGPSSPAKRNRGPGGGPDCERAVFDYALQKVKCIDISTTRLEPMVSVTTPSLLLDWPGTVYSS
jgi:hypothetical protein